MTHIWKRYTKTKCLKNIFFLFFSIRRHFESSTTFSLIQWRQCSISVNCFHEWTLEMCFHSWKHSMTVMFWMKNHDKFPVGIDIDDDKYQWFLSLLLLVLYCISYWNEVSFLFIDNLFYFDKKINFLYILYKFTAPKY